MKKELMILCPIIQISTFTYYSNQMKGFETEVELFAIACYEKIHSDYSRPQLSIYLDYQYIQ